MDTTREIAPVETDAPVDEFDACIGMTLADAMREGSKETAQAYNWGDGVETACALTAAGIVVRNKGYKVNNDV